MEKQFDEIKTIALRTLGVTEVPLGSNDGAQLRSLLRDTPFKPGEPWCYYWALSIMLKVFGGRAQLPQSITVTGSCQVAALNARSLGKLADSPAMGAIFVLRNSVGHFHHAGIVLDVDEDAGKIHTIEGNTNETGGTEGFGVFEHVRPISEAIRYITW